jgi:hypothetical protein
MNIQPTFSKIVGILSVMGFVLAPVAVFAEIDGDANVALKANGHINFCNAINSEDFKTLVNFQQGLETRDDHRGDRDEKVEEKRGWFDQKREDKQGEAQDKVEDRFAKLESKALTDIQKQGLLSARMAIQAAMDFKSSDMDAMIKEFRANMDTIKSEHRTEMDASFGNLKVALDEAIAKAKADCAAGVNPDTVRANFQASVKAAHDQFTTERKDIQTDTKADVKAEVGERHDERLSIGTSFRASIKSAWETFRSLFNKKAQ